MSKLALAALALFFPLAALAQALDPAAVTEGSMRAVQEDGKLVPLPLQHTDVQAEISGFVSRVQVIQTFTNPFERPIEAVYVFPLPDTGAVDAMTLRVGQRVIRGEIRKREEARQLYEAAKREGRTAALLDQERNNIFTQQVANILPGERILVTITYVAPLEYDHGQYTFNFPMVVGPRYIPGTGTGQVKDAAKLSPPLLPEGARGGHEVSLTVKLDAGVGLRELRSPSHDVEVVRSGMRQAEVRLRTHDSIPNKDFILRYTVAGEELQAGILTHRDERGGFFTLMIQPQADFRPAEITPKELFFVIDQSCSQSGLPMEKQKGIIHEALAKLNPNDTFNIVTFSSGVSFFSPRSLPNRPEHLERARAFVTGLGASGGTEMVRGITESLGAPRDRERLRMVLFLSDGYVGNDDQVIAEVQRQLGDARMFVYGVGSSVNHSLLRRMAQVGRGYYQYARVDEDTRESVERFYDRIARPYLVDVQLDYGDLGVSEVYPSVIGDLFAAQPIIVTGRYGAGGRGKFTLKGKIAGKSWAQQLEVELPRQTFSPNEALASMFGRARIEELSAKQYAGEQPELVEAITETALRFKLMSKYTSFVAVDEARRTAGGAPQTVVQPVEVPEGTLLQSFAGAGHAPVAATPPPPAPAQRSRAKMMAAEPEEAEPTGDLDQRLRRSAPGRATAEDKPAQPTPRVQLRLRELTVRGSQPKAPLEAAVRRALSEASRLVGPAASASGELTLAISFSADGKVKAVRVIHDGVGVEKVVATLKQRLAAARASGLTADTVVMVRIAVR